MKRRRFISGLLAVLATPLSLLSAPRNKVRLVATITPPVSGVLLTFTLVRQTKTALTDSQGQASVVMRYIGGMATVSGMVNGSTLTDSTLCSCQYEMEH